MSSRDERTSDLDLFGAWGRGDSKAAAELFERHFDAVDRFFRNKVVEGYEDLVQATFEAALKGRERFRGDSSFRTYLFGIANNLLLAHFRARKRDRSRLAFTEVSACDLAPGPSTIFRARREQQLLLEALRRIPLEYQTVLELYYWEELSGRAIAHIVELPENTVRSRIRKGKELLQRQMRILARTSDELQSTISDLEAWARSIHASASKGDIPTPS